MKHCKQACSDCPWRKKAAKGWLGGQDPDVFTGIIQMNKILPCHNTQKGKDLTLEELENNQEVSHCAGALFTMNNANYLSKSPEIAKAQEELGKNSSFFKNFHDFKKYHENPFFTIDDFLNSEEWENYITDDGDDSEAEKLYQRVEPKPKCRGCGDTCDELVNYYETFHGGLMSGNGYCIYCAGKD